MGDLDWADLTRLVIWGNAAVLAAAAALTIVRLLRGPSLLDRVVASDLLVTLLISAAALQIAGTRSVVIVPLLVTVSLVAFIGAVAVSRFVARDRDDHASRYGVDEPSARTSDASRPGASATGGEA